MAYRPSKRMHSSSPPDELNLTPIMNVFMIIIPFLLLTAVFAKTAIIDVYLPQEAGGASGGAASGDPGILSIEIKESGFELGGIGKGVVVPKVENQYDLKRLSQELIRIKEKYPQKEDVVLLARQDLSYETVVKVMDAARETDDGERRPLFPAVSLGEAGK